MGSGTRVYAERVKVEESDVKFGISDNFSFFLFVFWFLEIREDQKIKINK